MKIKKCDDDLLVELIAQGDKDWPEIADRLGLTTAAVRRIASGAARAELQPLIRQAELANIRRARRIGAQKVAALLQRQVDLGMEGDSDVARKCREFIIKAFLDMDDGGRAEPSPGQGDAMFMQLSSETKARVLEELDGPEPDWPEYEVES